MAVPPLSANTVTVAMSGNTLSSRRTCTTYRSSIAVCACGNPGHQCFRHVDAVSRVKLAAFDKGPRSGPEVDLRSIQVLAPSMARACPRRTRNSRRTFTLRHALSSAMSCLGLSDTSPSKILSRFSKLARCGSSSSASRMARSGDDVLMGHRHTSTDEPIDPACRPASSMPTGSSPKSVRRRTTICVCTGSRFSQDGTSP